MLLTGFDAKRLKKMYLARVVKSHNLLQTLTRVNRPYRNFKYGYVVDFADIRKEFDKTNREYFEELQAELGDETANYSNLFKSVDRN
jgi:type I restriction enzyme, R subunit